MNNKLPILICLMSVALFSSSALQASPTLSVPHGSPATTQGQFGDLEGNATVTLESFVNGELMGTVTKDNATGAFQWICDTESLPDDEHQVVLQATDSGGLSQRLRFKLRVTGLSRLEDWRIRNFGNKANAGQGADNADLNGDGVTNLQKFAFGLDPKKSERPDLRAISLASDAEPGMWAKFKRRKDYQEASINYVVEFSPDLVNWTKCTQVPTVFVDGVELQDVGVPFPELPEGMGAHFFRVILEPAIQ